MKQAPRTKLTRHDLDRLSERVRPLEREVVGGGPLNPTDKYGTLDMGALSCSGKPRNC